MVVVAQGDVFWADLPVPAGSGPGFRRPVVVIQGDALNRTSINTVICVPLTGNLRRAAALGNILLSARSTGLPRDSVASVAHVFAPDRSLLEERVGHLPESELNRVFVGLDTVLGR